jgi:hypothetical protein
MKTVFIATYYNAPHFMKLQLDSLNQFIDGEFDFVVIDDSEDDTKSLLSKRVARQEISEQASALGLKYVPVPQSVHANQSHGGLVPDGLPANHPTERHRACMHWILKNHKNLGFNNYDTMVIMESDMFIKQPLNMTSYMDGADLVGPGRKNVKLVKTGDPNQVWPEEIKDLSEITIDFFPMYMLAINMNTVKNIENLDIGGFSGTDTGGKTAFFLRDNPKYKCLFLDISGNKEYQIDFFHKNQENENSATFVHYRAGSLWDAQSIEYYCEKLNRLLKDFVPSLHMDLPTQTKDLMSRDKEHVFKK